MNQRRIQDTQVLGKVANTLVITNLTVNLFTSAQVYYEVRNTIDPPEDAQDGAIGSSTVLHTGSVWIGDADYQAWVDSDEYIVQKVADKIGVTLLPEESPGES